MAATRASEAVAARFTFLIARIAPRLDAESIAKSRVSAIRARLQGTFDLSRSIIAGSTLRGTGIRDYSDVDFFVVLRRDDVRWGGTYMSSNSVLGNVRAEIEARFPQTAVRRDGMAIVVRFSGTGPDIDVVPAVYERHAKPQNTPVYTIPDGHGGWMETSPDLQRTYFLSANLRSAGKLSRVVQIIKWWARARATPVPISSYYVEMVLAGSDICSGPRRYSEVVAESFALLAARAGRALNDPLGLSSRISLANTDAKTASTLRSLTHAAEQAEIALDNEYDGAGLESVARWRRLLPNFPASCARCRGLN